ncbi:hypothetical protein BD626DRAFT_39103 [Schizophyllum amplum]|uniref:Uncharacterized protein n=1 Tax=Schizophyllum amplum TaxID=97359 RepID=A0A550BT25_9AGAR|nr:hypothetical protein BD626DRAFT_39103 [Auriculariopsis ampla]
MGMTSPRSYRVDGKDPVPLKAHIRPSSLDTALVVFTIVIMLMAVRLVVTTMSPRSSDYVHAPPLWICQCLRPIQPRPWTRQRSLHAEVPLARTTPIRRAWQSSFSARPATDTGRRRATSASRVRLLIPRPVSTRLRARTRQFYMIQRLVFHQLEGALAGRRTGRGCRCRWAGNGTRRPVRREGMWCTTLRWWRTFEPMY